MESFGGVDRSISDERLSGFRPGPIDWVKVRAIAFGDRPMKKGKKGGKKKPY